MLYLTVNQKEVIKLFTKPFFPATM